MDIGGNGMLIRCKSTVSLKQLRNLDISIVFCLLLICAFGLANIFSTTHSTYGTHYFVSQMVWIGVGLAVVYLAIAIDYNIIAKYCSIFYWLSIALLVYTDVSSHAVKGAKAWISFGSISIEPGEFVKLSLALLLAKKIHDYEGKINIPKNLAILLLYVLLPIILLMKQPDLGVALICFCVALGIFFIGGLDSKVILAGLIGISIFSTLLWNSGLIKDYQKARITSYLNQDDDLSGQGLQLFQSKIAIGSGGIFGDGYLKGSQINSGAIPEDHTDFIFSAVGEEWGLTGETALLVLYSIILFKIVSISRGSKDILGTLTCIGIMSGFLFSILQNIGMTIGLMPISGITLPFMSYGGSSIISNFTAIGFVLNVAVRKTKINF